MPYEVVLDGAPAGYALAGATQAGERVNVAVREFTSSEDGELFISRLEGVPNDLLMRVPEESRVAPSMVDHLVAVILPDLSTTVYVNECDVVAHIRAARAIRAGEAVQEDDILDISAMEFRGVDCPSDAGFACVFSVGWRKGFFFDFGPLAPEGNPRNFDLEPVLGSYLAYLQNQALFSLSETEWDEFFRQGWFPFVSLPKSLLRQMIAGMRSGHSLDSHLPAVKLAILALEPRLRDRWESAPVMKEQLPLLERARERFLADDYESATALLYPRIEGILRTMWGEFGTPGRITSKTLAAIARQGRVDAHPYSWLLPDRFKRFLEDVYFANFAPGRPAPLSRHTVGHGVAAPEDFNLKSASLGLLIVDQLWCLMP